jgi:phosphoglycerate kinase
MLKSIAEATGLKGKRVLLRLDLNVPIQRGVITDDFRIQSVLPTINLLRDAGAKVIIVSHIEGKKNGGGKGATGKGAKFAADTLKPVADYLIAKKVPLTFVSKLFVSAAQKELDAMRDGDVLMFENLRANKGETENNDQFAEKLAAMAEVYVNEAFPVSHRAHASIVGVPKFLPSYAGPIFMREVAQLGRAFKPEKPFLFILGGAKFDTKMPLIKKFIDSADFLFIGGALANDFYKERGLEVGESTVSGGDYHLSELLDTKKVFIPTDVVTIQAGIEGTLGRKTKVPERIARNERILDLGTQSLAQLEKLVSRSRFILWNGPLGDYEEGFSEGTKKLAEIISKANAHSVVGGGDTVAAIRTLGLMDKFTFVSTGGGAMLDFLANETLPGIEALKNSK